MQITFEKLGFTYQPGTPLAFTALKDVSFTIAEHSYTAIVGHTGSGKSTLIQHLNGLLKPTTGTVRIGGQVITSATSNKDLNKLRRKVGYVFQSPEAQLFEETVLKDIEFAPLNFGYSPEEARQIPTVCESLNQALNALDNDRDFLTRTGVFSNDMIDAYLAIKREEVMQLQMTPHPLEYDLYYSL